MGEPKAAFIFYTTDAGVSNRHGYILSKPYQKRFRSVYAKMIYLFLGCCVITATGQFCWKRFEKIWRRFYVYLEASPLEALPMAR